MLDKFLSYGVNIANSAVRYVPSFESRSALVFSVALVFESVCRYKMETDTEKYNTNKVAPRINRLNFNCMSFMNGVQLATCLVASSASNSYKAAGVIVTMALSLPQIWQMMEHYLELKNTFETSKLPFELLPADRPTLYTHLRCGVAAAGGVAKVIQSLAVGFLIQNELRGSVLEKIWIIISPALLCLSCYNITSRREVMPL